MQERAFALVTNGLLTACHIEGRVRFQDRLRAIYVKVTLSVTLLLA